MKITVKTDVPFIWLRGVAACPVNLTLCVRRLRMALRLFFLLACLCLALPPMPGVAAPARKAVLWVFPYQSDLPRGVLARQAMLAEFGNATDLTIDWHYEYLDLSRFPGQEYEQQVADLCATKYRHTQIDLVFVISKIALDFWLRHRDEILPDAPIVFFDIEDFQALAGYQLPANMTGLISPRDHTQVLKWVSRTLPGITQIVLVHGVSEADRKNSISMEELQNDLDGQVQLVDWSHLPLAEIKQQAAALPPSSMIFYQIMFQDAAGVQYRPIDVLSELTSVSAVPVISTSDYFIGLGTIGGYMYSIEQVTGEAARLGERILRGEAASAIPIYEYSSERFIFDHLALLRFGFSLSDLPPDSIIKNRQYSFWELYRPQIIAAVTAIVILSFLVIFLLGLTRQLNRTRLALADLNINLETLVQERTAMLNQANRQLEAEVAELDAFAHTVAHDLKNPLGIIIGFAEVLVNEYETMSPKDVFKASRYIARTGEKLDTIIEELLLLAGVRKQEVIAQPLDMGSIVREAIERLQLPIQDRQAQITLHDEAAWPVALGHAPWIEEVWANYISNAVKYGGRPPRITVGATMQFDGQVRFWVKDNGLGLSKEAGAELFTPFTRLEQVDVKGHGLGLSVVQRIVDRLGGQVGVESEPGHGSTFFFTLPTGQ